MLNRFPRPRCYGTGAFSTSSHPRRRATRPAVIGTVVAIGSANNANTLSAAELVAMNAQLYAEGNGVNPQPTNTSTGVTDMTHHSRRLGIRRGPPAITCKQPRHKLTSARSDPSSLPG